MTSKFSALAVFNPPILPLCLLSCAVFPVQAENNTQLPTMTIEDSALLDTNPSRQTVQEAVGAPVDMGDYLRGTAGVAGIRMGGQGIDPVIRGQSQTRLNVLLDGAYVHGGCPNRMDPPTTYAPLDSYDQVTVLKGGHSVRYGGGGSGGTVLLERSAPNFSKANTTGTVSASYRDNADAYHLSAEVAAGNEQAYVRALGETSDADNYSDGKGQTVRSAYQKHSGGLMLGYTPDAHTRVELGYEAIRESDTLYAGAGMDAPQSDNDLWRLKFKRDTQTGPFTQLQGELYYSDVTHLMDNYSLRPLTSSTAMKMRVPSTSTTRGGRFSSDLRSGAMNLTLGVDYQQNQRDADRYAGMASVVIPSTLQAIMWPGADIRQSGLFAEFSQTLPSQDLLRGGLRYDYVDTQATRAAQAVSGVAPSDLYQRYYGQTATDHNENNLGGFLGYEHPLNPQTSLLFTLSRSLRTADASERYMAANNSVAAQRWVGNPQIDPEQHHQAELGLNWHDGGWPSSTALFYNQVSDYILRDRARAQNGVLLADGATIYRNVDARLYGLEWEIQRRWNAHWETGLSLAYVHAQNTSDDIPLAQTPPLEGRFNLNYRQANWHLGGTLRFAARQNRVDDAQTGSAVDVGPSAGFAALDLFGEYRINPQLGVRLGVDNLFDTAYAYHVNRANADPFNPTALRVNEPGRTAWLSLNGRF